MNPAPANSPVSSWLPPPAAWALGGDEVHVWRASLDLAPSEIQRFRHTLAADERARAARFHFEKDRGRFIVARGLLRAILGGYVNRAPAALSFRYSARGKPSLAGEPEVEGICFSVSHSHELALYAAARGREVGIDLERLRLDLAVAEIAERFFSSQEAATLRSLPPALQRQAFFSCWTRKEAYLKARGEGLSGPLDQFCVSLVPGEPAAIRGTPRDPAEAARWSLQELTPRPGYAATLAVAGHGWQLRCWQWPEPGPPAG